jgi:putative tryptophan/tyrosine transport system substrate-binding protein
MRRREFVTLLGGAAVTWPLPLRAQEAGKSYRVAYLTLAGGQDAVIVKQRLNELGYREGKNLIFDYRSAEGQLERLPQLAAESVATNPDVIVTGLGTETAKGGASRHHNHTHRFHQRRRSDRSRHRQEPEPA